jgi:hypothetical protein
MCNFEDPKKLEMSIFTEMRRKRAPIEEHSVVFREPERRRQTTCWTPASI